MLYQAWTGNRPTLDKLITWGCHVAPTQVHTRRNALEPRAHEGIFLGYTATMKNMYYLDMATNCTKRAIVDQVDKIQYADTPCNRSPASQHLIEPVTGSKSRDRRMAKMKDTNIAIIQDKTRRKSIQPHNQSVLQDALHQAIPSESPHHARAAKMKYNRLPMEQLIQEIDQLDVTLNPHEQVVNEIIPFFGNHATLGLQLKQHPEYDIMVRFKACIPGTPNHKNLKRWKSRQRGSTIRMINVKDICTITDVKQAIKQAHKQGQKMVKIQFTKPRWTASNGEGILTLHFDQLHTVAHHLHSIKTGQDLWTDRGDWPPVYEATIEMAIKKGATIPKLTRKKVMRSPDWERFRQSEWKQLT